LNIRRAQQRILLVAPTTALMTLLIAGLLGLGITHSIAQPLGRLMKASEALGRREFHHQVTVVGRDELARLGRTFNETASTLRNLYETLSTKEAYLAEAQRLSHTGKLWMESLRARTLVVRRDFFESSNTAKRSNRQWNCCFNERTQRTSVRSDSFLIAYLAMVRIGNRTSLADA